MGVHELLLRALAKLKFSQPTPVQAQCVPAGLSHRNDLVVTAETGSGKTIGFGLPMLHDLLEVSKGPSFSLFFLSFFSLFSLFFSLFALNN
jgi:superfamily II DNA/RNA helicase